MIKIRPMVRNQIRIEVSVFVHLEVNAWSRSPAHLLKTLCRSPEWTNRCEYDWIPLKTESKHFWTFCEGGRYRWQPRNPGLRGVLLFLQDDVHSEGFVPPHANLQQPQRSLGRRWPGPFPQHWAKGTPSFSYKNIFWHFVMNLIFLCRTQSASKLPF